MNCRKEAWAGSEVTAELGSLGGWPRRTAVFSVEGNSVSETRALLCPGHGSSNGTAARKWPWSPEFQAPELDQAA